LSALRRIVLAALIAGAAAGLVSAALQSVTTWPLIREAEKFETGSGHAHDHGSAPDAAAPSEATRVALTVLTDVLAGIGFALLLAGGFALADAAVDARSGAVWGMAGFAAFSLAPSLGLPPQPPGAAEADLAARQLWWVATATCTAGALWLIAFRRGAVALGAAIALIVVPHLVGAPQPTGESTVPAALASRFAAASLVTAAVFWGVLGATAGWIYGRFAR
jgi:cobalt transporter subunit CbtA